MSTLYLKTFGPSILGKFKAQLFSVLSYLDDTGIVYDNIYVEDTGGLNTPYEGLDWLATDAKTLKRKKYNLRSTSAINGFDYILDQTKPEGDYDVAPTGFKYPYDENVFSLYGKYLKMNPQLMVLVKEYARQLQIKDKKTLGVQLRTTDINHWHSEDGNVTYKDIARETRLELKSGGYEQIYLASDNIRDSLLFQYEFSKIVPVRHILHLCQDYIAPRSPDLVYFYNYVKQNFTYKDPCYWIVAYLDFCLLTLTRKKILRINSGNHKNIKALGSIMLPEIPVPRFAVRWVKDNTLI